MTNIEEVTKLIKKVFFKSLKIYSENFASVMLQKICVTLNKPKNIGASILALSKTVMYEFHYGYDEEIPRL